ncbi:MAG TPA: PLP-dependent aminotransferase family protein [Candidatus Saccharimonadales bacterium]|nr:PLP-dependent aminotransferase family protein [Candidatus Saccharimonadales bacterium]
MHNIPFSESGLRAVSDPMADIFRSLPARAAAYTKATGNEFISLAAGAPDPSLLPADICLQLAQEAASTMGSNSLNYTMPQGFPPLRGALEHMLTSQGVECDANDMLITSGGMEALSLGTYMLIDPGDTVLTEGPGFAGALSMFALFGANVVQIACSERGVTSRVLDAAIKAHKPKLVSLMPDYQNPTGAVMPFKEREAVAALLEKHDIFALEDGAYSQLRFTGDALPPLQSFAPDRVIYATSVSKIFAPAMRIGALIGPEAIIQKAGDIKSAYNMQASAIHQAITAGFLSPEEGRLNAHLDRLRTAYQTRCGAMLAALANHFPKDSGFSWTDPQGGMFLWLTGPQDVNFTTLFDRALENGVAYVPGSKFYTSANARHNAARLNFASVPEATTDEAIRRLAVTLNTH